MIAQQIAELFQEPCIDVAQRINSTSQRLNFTNPDLAFYSSQLAVDSDWLNFRVEPWAPQYIVHQQMYQSELFGNTHTDDPERYRARGYARVAGRRYYQEYSEWSGTDCESCPELLELPEHAYRSWRGDKRFSACDCAVCRLE
jgi:hypothetical protein